jgi:hypothetical protein
LYVRHLCKRRSGNASRTNGLAEYRQKESRRTFRPAADKTINVLRLFVRLFGMTA